jgi:hypothetical protein
MCEELKSKQYVEYDVLTTVTIKLNLFSDLTRYNFLDCQGFAGTCYLHLHNIFSLV